MSKGNLLRLGLLPELQSRVIAEGQDRRARLKVKNEEASGDPLGALYRAALNGTMSAPQATEARAPRGPEMLQAPPLGTIGQFDEMIRQNQEGIDRMNLDLASLYTEDPGQVPNYDAREALSKNELLISGGAALLASLLGARNASGALDTYVGGKKAIYDGEYKNKVAQREAKVEGITNRQKALQSQIMAGDRRMDSLYRARGAAAETERKTANDLMDDARAAERSPLAKMRAEFDSATQFARSQGLSEDAATAYALELVNSKHLKNLSGAELSSARAGFQRLKTEQEAMSFPAKLEKLLAEGDLAKAKKLESEARTRLIDITAKYFGPEAQAKMAGVYAGIDLRRKELDQRGYEFEKTYDRLTSDAALKYGNEFQKDIDELEAVQRTHLTLKADLESRLKPDKDGRLPLNIEEIQSDLGQVNAAIQGTTYRLQQARRRQAAASERAKMPDPSYAPQPGQVGPPAPMPKKKSEEPMSRGGVNRNIRGAEPVLSATNSVGFEEGKVCTGRYDCSSFTQSVARTLGRNIPRTALEQYQKLTPVPAESLKPGDFVYFNTVGDKDPADHAGVYIGGGRFRHASGGKKKGYRFKTSSLTDPYYKSRFSGARRA